MKLTTLSVLLCLFAVGCGNSVKQASPPSTNTTLRTDTAPIEKRLPKLGKLQSVSWNSSRSDIDSALSPPSHPAYNLRGFAQIEDQTATKLSQKFQWQRVSTDWKPSLTTTNFNLSAAEWSQSAEFTQEYKPQIIPGQLYFERQRGIVYFDLEIE